MGFFDINYNIFSLLKLQVNSAMLLEVQSLAVSKSILPMIVACENDKIYIIIEYYSPKESEAC